jgi:hypothetical protein
METNRRNFIGTGLAAPLILGASNKSGSSKPILGEGAHKYECTHDWGVLPANIRYGNTHGVCEDAQGHIYVHHTVNASHGLHILKEGKQEFLYLCDTQRGVVVKTTLAGEEVYTIGYPKESEQYKPGADGKPIKYSPTNLAVPPNGDLYVGDGYGSSYINQYNNKGEYIRTFGGLGSEPGQVSCPHGIICDLRGPAPVLMVADRANHRLQRFTLEGKHVDFLSGVNLPCHFNIFRNGDVVLPDLGARVTLLDKNNQVILHLGEDTSNTWGELRKQPRDKFIAGKFVCPHGACFDHAGNIFVVEWVEVGRVTKLRKVA